MGKGTIVSHIADGEYNVTLKYNRDDLNAAIAVLEARETLLIDAILNETDETKKKLLRLQLVSVQKRIAYLQDTDNVPADETITAWCADLTTDLTGDVGLIEIGRERVNGVNIQPGHDANAVFDAARDGQLTPLMAQDPAATFYNLAMLPGAQKWKPTYLYGEITAIDYEADTCSLNLDLISSSQQSLDILQDDFSLIDVPIVYMTCNAAAFVEGDRVLVHFKEYDFAQPEVIGFKAEPKSCFRSVIVLSCRRSDSSVEYKVIRYDGTVSEVPINSPSGSGEISQPFTSPYEGYVIGDILTYNNIQYSTIFTSKASVDNGEDIDDTVVYEDPENAAIRIVTRNHSLSVPGGTPTATFNYYRSDDYTEMLDGDIRHDHFYSKILHERVRVIIPGTDGKGIFTGPLFWTEKITDTYVYVGPGPYWTESETVLTVDIAKIGGSGESVTLVTKTDGTNYGTAYFIFSISSSYRYKEGNAVFFNSFWAKDDNEGTTGEHQVAVLADLYFKANIPQVEGVYQYSSDVADAGNLIVTTSQILGYFGFTAESYQAEFDNGDNPTFSVYGVFAE